MAVILCRQFFIDIVDEQNAIGGTSDPTELPPDNQSDNRVRCINNGIGEIGDRAPSNRNRKAVQRGLGIISEQSTLFGRRL